MMCTRGHFADADSLAKIMEVVTGVNSNAMGQYNSWTQERI